MHAPYRFPSTLRSPIGLIALAASIVACMPQAAQPAARSSPPSPPGMSATALPSAAASASQTASQSQLALDSTVVTTENRLRVRSAPAVSDDSRLLEPLLPRGTKLFVLQGSVNASGYVWYQVLPVGEPARALPHGWVAAASREGQPWLASTTVTCPAVPETGGELAGLDRGTRLACFARRQIEVRARLIECNCDLDAPGLEPAMLTLSGTRLLLVAPDTTTAPADAGTWLTLQLDPTARRPDPLPVGRVATVSGQFDHPAAAQCMERVPDSNSSTPSPMCRWMFVVSGIS